MYICVCIYIYGERDGERGTGFDVEGLLYKYTHFHVIYNSSQQSLALCAVAIVF